MKEVMLCCFMLFLYSCTSATSSLNSISSSATSVDMQARMENNVGSEGQANNNNYNTIRRSIGEEMKNGHGGVGGGQGGSAGGYGGDNGSHQPGSSNVIPIYAANSHHNPHHGKGSASTITKLCPWVPALFATLLLLFLGSGFSPVVRI
nr:uncharacterized protein LOC109176826 isoform X1 [Ipomoea trifida]